MDVSDLLPNASLEVMKNCLVGTWKTIPNPAPTSEELEETLSEDLFLLKFAVHDDAKRVLEEGKRTFRGDLLLLE